MRIGRVFPVALIALAAFAAEPFRYSEAPLQQAPLLTASEVATGAARLYSEIDDPRSFLNDDRKSAKRRQAYLLIDSILKRQRAEGRAELNDSEKTTLRILLNQSTQFGVYGAGLVARHLAGAQAGDVAEPLLPPDPFELRLEFPQIIVSSHAAPWRLEFPWYFMFWRANRFVAKNGLDTHVVAVSTSFARQDGPGKHSQAEILFIYSPAPDCVAFDPFWLDQLDMADAVKSDDALLPSSVRYTKFDAGKHFRKEITLSARSDGCAAFAYLGFAGPFVANRVSYVDFVSSFSDFSPSVPDASVPRQASWLPCPQGQVRYESNCIAEPVIVKKVSPEYPGKALMEGVEGQVTLQAFIDSDGSVTNVLVDHCTHPGYGLEKAAMKAVRKWRYTPSTVNEWPRSVPFKIVVTFEIPRRSRKAGREGTPPPYDAETLAKKRRKILDTISNLWCKDDSQCAGLALGSKPCGGPRENRVFSLAMVEERRLSEAVADYNAYEAGWNEQEGLTSDCSVAPAAQPACVDRNCIDRNLPR